ncbi:MAG: murein biosynthesis integral membrane protein MurJ [Actinomycetaceae bacterium]|nr:murein biosynthesis integral membrane protein MurJ [Actinomycetaceae bacterium]
MARSSFIMFLGTLVSRILGMVRSPIMLGAVVGLSTPVANSFDIANNLPNLLYGILAGGLVNAVLVPAIVKATEKGRREGEVFINKLLTFSIVVLGAITAVITLAAPLVVKAYAAQMSPEWYHLTVVFAYWCLPQIFFYSMYAILGQILNAYEKFGPYMWSPALNNVIAIIGLVILLFIYGPEDSLHPSAAADWAGMRTVILAGFSTLGIAMQALILLIPMYRLGIRYKPDFRWRGSGLADVGKTGSWVLALVLAGMIPVAVLLNVAVGATERALATGIPTTEVAGNFTYNVAYALATLPNSLITVSILTAIFPRMARAATRNNYDALRSDTSLALRTIITFNAIATSGLIVLSVPFARIMAPASQPAETWALAKVLIALSLGIIFIAIHSATTKVFYALEDTRSAFLTSAPVFALQIVGYLALNTTDPRWTVVGLALVNSLTNMLIAVIQYALIRKRIGGLNSVKLLKTHLAIIGVGVLTGVVGWGAMQVFGYDAAAASVTVAVTSSLVVGVLMVVVYIVLLKLFRLPEAEILMAPVRKIFGKLRRR